MITSSVSHTVKKKNILFLLCPFPGNPTYEEVALLNRKLRTRQEMKTSTSCTASFFFAVSYTSYLICTLSASPIVDVLLHPSRFFVELHGFLQIGDFAQHQRYILYISKASLCIASRGIISQSLNR